MRHPSQWHIVYQASAPGKRRTWFADDGSPLFEQVQDRLKVTELEQLKATAYISWGDEVDVVLSTKGVAQSPKRTALQEVTATEVVSGWSRTVTFGFGVGPVAHVLNINLNGSVTQREQVHPGRTLRNSYERRFRDLYRQLVVMYDNSIGRAWLIPKVNVVLMLVRMYMTDAKLKNPVSINYPTKRYIDGGETERAAWLVIESLQEQEIERQFSEDEQQTGQRGLKQSSGERFGHLFMDFGEDLHNNLKTIQRIEARDHRELYCLELMDVYEGNIGVRKKLPVAGSIHHWFGLLHGVGVIVCRTWFCLGPWFREETGRGG